VTPSLGLYVHVPFCRQRCSYCAFVTWADRDEQQAAYFQALRTELRTRCAGATFDTIYFGGGTPSLPDPSELRETLRVVEDVATIAEGAEITLEVNPESCDERRATQWREAGFDRASVGVQSFDPKVLGVAGRLHGPDGPPRAVAALRAAGFANLSVDLIAGLPHESLLTLRDSRRRALDLEPEHVSLYLLELDEAGKSTPLSAAVRAGRVRCASDDELADWYEESREELGRAGLPAYEISNFAKPGRMSRHNLKYWRCEPFLGAGVGAHWNVDGLRRFDVSGFEAWLALVAERGDGEAEESRAGVACDVAQDKVMLGLRLVEGIDLGALDDAMPGTRARFEGLLERHASAGLVERDGIRWRLTVRGALLSNEVFSDVIAA
jgi:oxygen-independent coproporphyrinogen-3 oxidase